MKGIVEINEPFYTAGRKYGWDGPTIGLGIRKELLEGEGLLKVRVSGKPTIYTIDKLKARDIALKYRSFHTARSVTIWVLPWSEFDKIEPPKPKVPEQGKLFTV